jgi:ferric-dicitrate binding protein FerR (iron transport regulator)
MRRFKLILSIAAVLLLAGGGLSLWQWQARMAPRYLQLPDGTEAFFRGDSTVRPAAGFPSPREIAVDGDIFFRVPQNTQILTLRSRLLVLSVTGDAAMRMTAYSKQAGEQVEVLYGSVTARKNYDSPYKEPDILTGGQMTMINRDIDLMDKETTDVAQLRAWSDALIASVSRKPS